MKSVAIAATVVASLAGLAAANPVAEPQGFGWWGRRPTVYTTITVDAPGPTDSPAPVNNNPAKPSETPKTGGSGGNGGGFVGSKGAAFPFYFTSTYAVIATPDQVINGTVATPGEPGAVGIYNYGINSDLEVICYNITLGGVTGNYQSAAKTATHIHQAVKGASGPPRIALPNPLPISDDPTVIRRSVGCLTGPFTTGILANGTDTGAGFSLKQIEANPAGFFTDAHTVKYVPGVVRGQLA
ncbi:hypothetical protein LTR84_011480 [Exophiala bonariae]|uniref:CHRD domain-containing protein n=1 Tax=Exophiala bonariae TaxID=1690606 RepID=A0AAV9NG41_9EURO|nr:hypothetical protein LTR84_011480 [Exophiala bonariae]